METSGFCPPADIVVEGDVSVGKRASAGSLDGMSEPNNEEPPSTRSAKSRGSLPSPPMRNFPACGASRITVQESRGVDGVATSTGEAGTLRGGAASAVSELDLFKSRERFRATLRKAWTHLEALVLTEFDSARSGFALPAKSGIDGLVDVASYAGDSEDEDLAGPAKRRETLRSRNESLASASCPVALEAVKTGGGMQMLKVSELLKKSGTCYSEARSQEFGAQSIKRRLTRQISRIKKIPCCQLSCCQLSEGVIETVMGAVIMLNVVVMGVSLDWDKAWAGWIAIDALFAVAYVWEVLMKWSLFGLRHFFCGTSARVLWNYFDVLLCLLCIIEVVISIFFKLDTMQASHLVFFSFRLLRVCRILRLVRLFRLPIFRHLLMMIQGLSGGMQTLFWSGILILVPLYSIAVVVREDLGNQADHPDEAISKVSEPFRNIPMTMFTIFRCVVSTDCSDRDGRPIPMLVTEMYGLQYAAFYSLFMLFMTFGLFNVIVALFVESTVVAAKRNDERTRRRRLMDWSLVAEKTTQLLQKVLKKDRRWRAKMGLPVTDDDAALEAIEISYESFQEALLDREVQKIFDDLEIGVIERMDLFETLDVDSSGSMTLEELLHGIVRLRGQPRRSDVIGTLLRVSDIQKQLVDLKSMLYPVCDRAARAKSVRDMKSTRSTGGARVASTLRGMSVRDLTSRGTVKAFAESDEPEA
eukprot:TRINITY_DN26154_c0_g1_i1.p1 TRINITY_DN26154_c0_g1~~TRINITY_DN26154_c0_g1_i1.p1  ORF type:complete len:700 (-),score=136.58 TRINITY_DN26154_c0_g1_i1:458-2557(-)